MFVSNLKTFGHLINADHFSTIHKRNELWQIYDNPTVSIDLFFFNFIYW